jgi:hypothetical protein
MQLESPSLTQHVEAQLVPTPFMPRALVIPGALHICSNLSKDISSSLEHWGAFLKQLKTLHSVLCDRDRRERFIEKCIGDHPDAKLFEAFSGSLYEKRWGAVVNFLQRLKPVFEPLKQHWSAPRYISGHAPRDGESGFDPKAVTDVLTDRLFTCYVDMVLALFNLIETLSRWFEGCSCHEHLLASVSPHRSKAMLAKEFGLDASIAECPMKGKRAPELAVGSLRGVIDEVWSASRGKLIEKMAAAQLDSQQQFLVMQDVQSGEAPGISIKGSFDVVASMTQYVSVF